MGRVLRALLLLAPALVEPALPGDPVLRGIVRQLGFRRWVRLRPGEPLDTPARFTERPDGSVHLEQATTLMDGRTLTIRGARVSRATVACGG